MLNLSFYNGKRVFITGHTGFKGSWMCRVLRLAGAEVCGYSLAPPTDPSLFHLLGLEKDMRSIIGDVRDLETLKTAMAKFKPDVAIHMAAQPIVRESYLNPVETYSTNVMGTVHFLEAVRGCETVCSVVNVTTDKVYRNNEWEWGYREVDALDGYDPYSNSKSCSELVTASYKRAFFLKDNAPPVSACRAGNVIGGGDFAADRIIPDCVRAAKDNKAVIVRNEHSTRPYQHVLEPVCAYLMVAARQYEDKTLAGVYNIGPDDCDCVTTRQLVERFCSAWGEGMAWENLTDPSAPHEANFLKLDSTRLKQVFGWRPRWHVDETIDSIVTWSRAWLFGGDFSAITDEQITAYLGEVTR